MSLALGAVRAGAQEESVLRIAIPTDYANLSVYTAGASDADPFVGLIYDTLFSSPYVDEPQPLLATSAEAEPGNRTWTIALREGVQWHDGRPFTARDVVFTYELYRDGEPNRWTHHASDSPDMERVEALDESTVRITCAQPCPTLRDITLADLPILPAHVWSAVEDPQTFDGVAVGTGPYRVQRYTPGERYLLEANESYHSGEPVADRLELAIIPEPSSAFLALRSGQVDAVSSPLPPQLVESFEDDEELEVLQSTPFSDAELVFNMDREPLGSTALRRAAMLAIDKDRLLETVLLGRGLSGTQSWPHPQSPWTSENPPMPHDPREARRLIDEAGLAGTEIEILVPQQQPTVQRGMELAAADLRAVGIETSLRPVDAATRAELTAEGDFDAYVWVATAHALADPTQLIQSFESSSYLGTYDNPEVARLLTQAEGADTVEEFRSLISSTHGILADDPPVVPLFYPEERYAVRPAAFDGWEGSPGLGVVHKFSLVGEEGSTAAVSSEESGGPSTLGIVIAALAVAGIAGAVLLRRRRSGRANA
ncbi:MAG: ABC transporter substrate-binding protein [Solirubrobacteraceae bacterium MAG38_C4-C5]|nr:ABC transporter substrate-binding protein [Candidatus Siliceabacter maunaloa]